MNATMQKHCWRHELTKAIGKEILTDVGSGVVSVIDWSGESPAPKITVGKKRSLFVSFSGAALVSARYMAIMKIVANLGPIFLTNEEYLAIYGTSVRPELVA